MNCRQVVLFILSSVFWYSSAENAQVTDLITNDCLQIVSFFKLIELILNADLGLTKRMLHFC